jgi:predicted acetyltransferase
MAASSDDAVGLAVPHEQYEWSYRTLIDEFKSRGEHLVPFTLAFEYERFEDLVFRLKEQSEGIGLPKGFVPNSSYWLVRGSDVIGVSNLRHKLTAALRREGGHIGYGIRPSLRGRGFGTAILRYSLAEARAMGLKKVLLTCGKENTSSAKVILANGGVLASEEFYAPRNEVLQKYWIDLGATAT